MSSVQTIPYPGPPVSTWGTGVVGEVVVDSDGITFICVAGGRPGRWQKIGVPGGGPPYTPGAVFDVRKDFGATGNGVTDDTDAIQAAIDAGGLVFAPAGKYLVNKPLVLHSGMQFVGAGKGITTMVVGPTLAANGGGVFQKVVPTGDSLTDVLVSDLSIDGTASGSGGSVDGVYIDTSASSSILINNILTKNVYAYNLRYGFRQDGNNGSSGPSSSETWTVGCRADSCLAGFIATGTYAAQYSQCFASKSVAAGWAEGGTTTGVTVYTGSGPTTNTSLSDCHVEGGGDTTTDSGIYISATQGRLTNIVVSNVNEYGLWYGDSETVGSVLDNITIYGSGYSGIILAGIGGLLTNFSLFSVGIAGNVSYGQQSGLNIAGGDWTVDQGAIAPNTSLPSYALSVGGDQNDAYAHISVSNYYMPGAYSVDALQILNAQTGVLEISHCFGYNPTGAQTAPTVPASGTALTNPFPFDCTVYVNGGTVTEVAVGGTSTGATGGAFRVAAGQSITLTYSAAPTWTWFGD